MRTTIDMPDALLRRVKIAAAQRKTTFRAMVVDALERTLDDSPSSFRLEDVSVGSAGHATETVSSASINQAIDAQRETGFNS